ncbi:hypothetical protein [Vibrio phage vB_VmeM-Yong XC32]|nr:hypothetical protein [Vibrio phage vB_VmeM-Yong XC31]QAX96523.1 hypothetical protein [Vibrio phage vB_VmeM-Yong XC32]QAX96841.1 hypothetical protein [Vibrio phage vB_VmeM-Yong MS31]QAX97146.1 hypothetical protein [Vibrio phage vB_VmeM-Yong MS32]
MKNADMLSMETLVNDVILIPILGMDLTNDLKAEGIVPCSLEELNQYRGSLVAPLLEVLNNAEFLDDLSDDFRFTCEHPFDMMMSRGYNKEISRRVPVHFEVIFEDDYIKTTVDSGLQWFEYYFSTEGKLLRSVCTSEANQRITTRVYQYSQRGHYMGFVSFNESNSYVAYHHRRAKTPGVFCEQRIFKERWEAVFGVMCERNDIMPEEVEEKFRWDDYKNREALRMSQGLGKGEFTVTHHRAMFQEQERFGHVMYTYTFRDNMLYQKLSHRFITPHKEIDGEIKTVRDEHIPKCSYYQWDANKRIERIAYGGGHFADYDRRLDPATGKTVHLVCDRYSVHFETRIPTSQEELLVYVGGQSK